jgi:hypothetical protein
LFFENKDVAAPNEFVLLELLEATRAWFDRSTNAALDKNLGIINCVNVPFKGRRERVDECHCQVMGGYVKMIFKTEHHHLILAHSFLQHPHMLTPILGLELYLL